jgi:3-hydroxyisobutyrate dehydrogenase
MRAGIVGAGMIGSGVARALRRAGHEVTAYDVAAEAVGAIADVADAKPSPREAADSADAVFVAVYDDRQVREVLEGQESVLAAATPPRAVVILSTVPLETIRWAADRGAAQGVSVLDCGVTGGPGLRERGEIVAMVGGDDEAVAAVRPLIETFGKPTIHTGPLGTGMNAKIARNLFTYATWLVALEAGRLAESGGVPRERFVEICEAGDQMMGGPLAILKRMNMGSPPASAEDGAARERLVGYVHKDLHAAFELADELGVEVPAARLTDGVFEDVLGIGSAKPS